MKSTITLFFSLLLAVTLYSCGDDYDDSALRNDVNDLKSRVEKLEAWCSTANTQISALQGLVTALEQKDYVTGVTPIMEGSEETGYTITFSKSDPITILHGKDGTNGINGITPIIGVKQDTDGTYYWTIQTGDAAPAWMTDADGNKIRTTGNDGVSMKPVISVDTDTDGKLYWKVDGEWLTDAGGKKVPATGPKGDTGASGSSGSQGAQGPQGDAIFAKEGINLNDPQNVTFTLANGTTITLPRSAAIGVGANGVAYYKNGEKSVAVPINLPGNFAQSDYASIMAEVKSSAGTSIDIKTREADAASPWTVEVTAPTFDEATGAYNNDAQVKLTAPTGISTGATAWLEVTLLDGKGMKSVAACVIKVVDEIPSISVTNETELKNAIAAATGTADNPTVITLGADITVPAPDEGVNAYAISGRHIAIDGGGHTLTRADAGTGIFYVAEGASLRLANLTLDGENKEGTVPLIMVGDLFDSGTAALTLGSGFRLTNAVSAVANDRNGIDVESGTLTVEDGAEITGNGTGWAVRVMYRGTVQLKGGKISGNSGYGLGLMAVWGEGVIASPAVTVGNALPEGSRFDLYLHWYAADATTVSPGGETIVTAGGGYTLTDADAAKFTLQAVAEDNDKVYTSGFGLRLDKATNAVCLRATDGVTVDMDALADRAAVAAAIKAALGDGATRFILRGPFAKTGIGEGVTDDGPGLNPFAGTAVEMVDLTGVTGWPDVDTDADGTADDGPGLPAYAFDGLKDFQSYYYPALKEVRLPDGVKVIGASAFRGCTALADIPLDGVEVIGVSAFLRCTALTTGSLPKVQKIMEAAFSDCAALTEVNITTPAGGVIIGASAFSHCSGLAKVNTPAAAEVGANAFLWCEKLTDVTLPAATKIGSGAFQHCSALQSLALPAATAFGSSFLYEDDNLTTLKLTAPGIFTTEDGTTPLPENDPNINIFNQFGNAANCALTLNADKKPGAAGNATPKATDATTWWWRAVYVDRDRQWTFPSLTWKSISYAD